MTDKPTCKTCMYWDRKETGHEYADCRRMPPIHEFSAHFTKDGYRQEVYKATITRMPHGYWPNVSQDDWCGEHPQFKEKVNE